jgi:hypothetical protein
MKKLPLFFYIRNMISLTMLYQIEQRMRQIPVSGCKALRPYLFLL